MNQPQKNQIIICKFGGTSMGHFSAMFKSAHIVLKNRPKVIVVSATSGTTDMLMSLISTTQREKSLNICSQVKKNHLQILDDIQDFFLQKKNDQNKNIIYDQSLIQKTKDRLKQKLTNLRHVIENHEGKFDDKVKAEILSYGEILSSILFHCVLSLIGHDYQIKIFWMDARSYIYTNSNYLNASPKFSKIKNHMSHIIANPQNQDHCYLTQGFIGKNEFNETTTLGRGGSDYTAAIMAEALNADLIQIWTDVPGIATTDPRIFPKAPYLRELSFVEAIEMASLGAKVLHPKTLLPAMRKEIPIFIGSTFSADLPGTIIRKKVTTRPLVRAMATQKGLVLISFSSQNKKGLIAERESFHDVFYLFKSLLIPIESSYRSRTTLSIIVKKEFLSQDPSKKDHLLNELQKWGEVRIEDDLKQISLISNIPSDSSLQITQKIMNSFSSRVKLSFWDGKGAQQKIFVSSHQEKEMIQHLHEIFF